VLMDDRSKITSLEERLAGSPAEPETLVADLEVLADLYIQADSYVPALETIDRLLSLPAARGLAPARRSVLQLKAASCRRARGEAQAALAQLREALRELPQGEDPLRAQFLLELATTELQLGRIAEAGKNAESALVIGDRLGDLTITALSLQLLGYFAYREGDLMRARDLDEQALALFRRLGRPEKVAGVRNNLGLVHKNLCEWDVAIGHLSAALQAWEALGRFAESGPAHMNLGIVHQKMGAWELAAESYRNYESILLRIGDDLHLAHVNIGLGNVARLQRRFVDAETHLLAALERARRHSLEREHVLALEFLGELDFDRGRPERALARYHEALAMAEHTAPEGDLVVELERRRAEALLAIGRIDEAEKALDRGMRLARFTDDRLEHAIAHRVAGDLAVARGRRLDARERWQQAATLLTACRERYELARTQLLLARSSDDPRAARSHALRACALFAELGSPWWQEQAEAELSRLMGPAPVTAPTRTDSLLGKRHRAPGLVACSTGMRTVERLAQRAAATELSVLLTGETGTGKELVARTIHAKSPRVARPFLAVNCGALRADLALSQLFGHRKGAFTGAHAEGVGLVEAAHGGTLFLDEAG